MSVPQFKSFKDFYPYYLQEHSHPLNRFLHFVGTSLAMLCVLYALVSWDVLFFFLGLFSGYFFAWIGHFFIEKNRPATFSYPGYSLLGDFLMYWELLTRKRSFRVD